jgi:hypothetical protein
VMNYPRTHVTADESILEQHLADARALFAERTDAPQGAEGGLSADLEGLRWFDLPTVCLS